MAKRARSAGPRTAPEDTTYEEGDETQDDAIQGDEPEDGEEDAEGAPDDSGEEQEGGEPEELELDDGDDEPPRRPSRSERRIRAQQDEISRLRSDLDQLRRSSGSQPPPRQQPTEETEEQFQQRMALLDPDQRLTQTLARSQRQMQSFMQQTQLQNAITTDRATFEAKAVTHIGYKAYAAEVEAEFQRRLQMGVLVPREDIYNWLIGKQINAGDPKALKVARRLAAAANPEEVERARRQGKQRVERQRARSSNTRDDQQIERGRNESTEREARRRRLANVTF
jgi:hypothetical protein